MNCGLERGGSWRRPFPSVGGLGAQFQCRLFRLVQAPFFGVPAGTSGAFSGHSVLCLVVFVGFCLATLVLITAGFDTLGGRSVVMVSLPGLVNRPRRVFGMSCWCCLAILLVLLLRCWVGSYPFGTALVNLHVGFPLGVFLLVVMFRVLSLSLLVLRRSGRFASRVPTMRLPALGHVAALLVKGVRKLVLCGWSMVLLLVCRVLEVVMAGLVGLVEALKESD